jgi:hypothetical protein
VLRVSAKEYRARESRFSSLQRHIGNLPLASLQKLREGTDLVVCLQTNGRTVNNNMIRFEIWTANAQDL